MDIVDSPTRSRMMSGIRGKNTRPEVALRRALHACGFRYRLHVKQLPGKPDLVLARYQAVIFVHGCFWHHHGNCAYAATPATRADFWMQKFRMNIARDHDVKTALLADQWRVATIWECALKNGIDVRTCVGILSGWLRGEIAELELGAQELQLAKRTADQFKSVGRSSRRT